MNSFTITINGEDVTAYTCYPFAGELTLDRSLDQAYIDLKASPRSEPYPPFSEVFITPNQGEATTFVIASDDVETFIKTGLSNHHLLLCEETKKLERVICPGKTFVQPLIHNYADDVLSDPETIDRQQIQNLVVSNNLTNSVDNRYELYNVDDYNYTTLKNINAVIYPNMEAPSVSQMVTITPPSGKTYKIIGYAIIAVDRNGFVKKITSSPSFLGNLAYNQITGYDPSSSISGLPVGGYELIYLVNIGIEPPTPDQNLPAVYSVAAKYDFAVIPYAISQKPPLYITDVTNQLLEIAEPIRRGEPQRFTLDLETAARYATTPCNELNFANGATLRENLDEIAGIVHCITRLKNGKIYFDPVGDPVLADSTSLGDPVSVRSSANLEKYATHLDSFVDNLMNAQDPKQGAISDPFVGVYRTARALISNTDARVTVSNCRIDTTFGVEKIEKVDVLYNGIAYDITAFVYEKSEYDLLETNSGVYPYAKAYAIYYTQGQKGLDGLTHRVETAIAPAFQNLAIANILSIVTGQNLDWKSDLFGTAILDYAFNVTYISAIRGRVRAAKTDISDVVATSAMAFNQAAPRLSSVNYGERLKGETAMLSEPEVHLVFKTSDLSAVIGSVGKLYIWNKERYYISKVTYKVWSGYIIAEMTLSRNFNQLGRFVSINNSFRQFEIDDNSQEECIVYEDYAVFSTIEPTDHSDTSLQQSNGLLNAIQSRFITNTLPSNIEVTIAKAFTYDAESNLIGSFYLPVQSLALGNSLLFNFAFKDNYSAGDFVQDQGAYKLTRAAAYGDPLYGEAKYLGFQLGCGVSPDSATLIEVGNSIPLTTNALRYTTVINTSPNPLIVNKSSRDVINLTYQLHHVTDSGIIFGSALTQKNYLVSNFANRAAYMVALPFEINPLSPPRPTFDQFEGSNDGQGGTVQQTTIVINGRAVQGYEINAPEITDGVMTIAKHSDVPTGENIKSWAIYSRMGAYADNDSDNVDTEFLIGGNGQPPDNIYVYLKHNII